MIYDEIVEQLGIKSGEKLWISSDITRYVLWARKNKEEFSPARLIEVLQESVGSEGTLLFPVFSFEFSNHGRYDYKNSKGTSGHLGNLALSTEGFRRTSHPMHSFAVWGRDRDMLCAMENLHSFGDDSPFGYCRTENVRQLMLGTDHKHAMTYVHYVETVCRVPYRFAKTFRGIYVTEDGKEEEREYLYAARRLDVGTKECFNRMGDILEQAGIGYAKEIRGIENHSVLLGSSHEPMCDDILHNMCRNLYDFEVSREELFKGYGEGS